MNIRKAQESIDRIEISFMSELSNKLDPDELNEEKQIGEGSFGIVFKGTFRNNIVAFQDI